MFAIGNSKIFLNDNAIITLKNKLFSQSSIVIQSFIRKKQAERKLIYFHEIELKKQLELGINIVI